MSSQGTLHAVQLGIVPAFDSTGAFVEDAIQKNVRKICDHVLKTKGEVGPKLLAFPEFSLHGYKYGVGVEDWLRASIIIPGPETDAIAEAAQAADAYVSFCTYELIPDFPGRFFNTNVIIAPNGEIVHVYRKLYAMTAKTRPGDVYDQWIEKFGADSLFPIIDTPLGKIGALIARDIHWPEAARTLALKGAEIIINPLGAGRSATEGKTGIDWIRPVRAHENLVYILCANIGPFDGDTSEVAKAGRTKSEIVDYTGAIVARADNEDETVVSAQLDLTALRKLRTTKNVNYLAQLQPFLHVHAYENAHLFPKNGWAGQPIEDAEENTAMERRVIEQMLSEGILQKP